MASYDILVQLAPAGAFGLPEPGYVVVPPSGEQIVSPAIDSRTGNIVCHGTLSVFRKEEEKLSLQVDVEDCHISLYDNYIHFRAEAATPNEALSKVDSL